MTIVFSKDCLEVLASLKERRNVLISGPPAAGKSRLLNEVAAAFQSNVASPTAVAKPLHDPSASVPIPAHSSGPKLPPELAAILPDRANRKVFRTVFHQNSKHREFLTGITPSLGAAGTFKVMEGILYRASEHARSEQGASLLIIDEINRGPAVQIFGGAIVAIEGEKRLSADGTNLPSTQFFELLDPKSAELVEYAFPHHLYILAAMNQADVSVEPLDVAFLRRWSPFRLEPNEAAIRQYFGLPASTAALPSSPATAGDVLEAAVQAWAKVNERISIGRGREYQLGHGALVVPSGKAIGDVAAALKHAANCWNLIKAHADEVFFGDVRGLSASLNALGDVPNHPYVLEEAMFADEPRPQLRGPLTATSIDVFKILASVAS